MIYGVCLNCAHTKKFTFKVERKAEVVYSRCYSCGCVRLFRVVRQIEQPDGSVIEVSA